MDLERLYSDIMRRGQNSVLSGKEYVDKTIDDCSDTRMGLTLVIRPTMEIQNEIERVISELRRIEPSQYYYPREDFHITLFDIITARQGFQYTENQKMSCISLSEEILKNFHPFHIEMKGLTMSESCIMAKGFCDMEMQQIRGQLREHIAEYGLVLDERYPTKSSHITIARFKNKLQEREKLVEKISELGQVRFGIMNVTNIELTCHNWFDSKKELIRTFCLK
ncbi:MAG: 2'-5' RNA ligase family protein [Lactobacillus johnsonii]|uniref:2'-5' RNA ligase family protein n=1 Tax=Faecalicatena sp. TaxID=2005360 RepID=UPI00258D60EB|nr:2'-5' RNA ligase family protein [Faecalicatena sp.]MCI6464320.1 2'-5' RNA ligase family protein [Faecalicatena sp.]MDY4502317.1 2'-5' RNA ligase family protein [Lactobacillus johnsonii]MDY5621294.1 2'-5' RNA ligase family protein [Lachnospiraceae bacterium]